MSNRGKRNGHRHNTHQRFMGGVRNLKLGQQGQGAGHRGNNFVCGPNVDFIQLLCASKRHVGLRGPGTERPKTRSVSVLGGYAP